MKPTQPGWYWWKHSKKEIEEFRSDWGEEAASKFGVWRPREVVACNSGELKVDAIYKYGFSRVGGQWGSLIPYPLD